MFKGLVIFEFNANKNNDSGVRMFIKINYTL